MKRLAEIWADYDARVLPSQASATQRDETRLSFMAGAYAAFEVFLSTSEMSDEDGALVLTELQAEIADFQKETELRAARIEGRA